jgi:hypothetical protein
MQRPSASGRYDGHPLPTAARRVVGLRWGTGHQIHREAAPGSAARKRGMPLPGRESGGCVCSKSGGARDHGLARGLLLGPRLGGAMARRLSALRLSLSFYRFFCS